MKWGVVIILLFFIIITVIGVVVYLTYEKPVKDAASDYANISVSAAQDTVPDRNIAINYKIYSINSSFVKEGTTLKSGAVLEKIPINYSYIIEGYSTDTDSYYSSKSAFNTYIKENKHIRLILKKAGEINISGNGNIRDNNLSISLELTHGTVYLYPILCVKKSFHILKADINLTAIREPEEYQEYDTCYALDTFTEENYKKNINVLLFTWGVLNSEDFLEFVILDRDLRNDMYFSEFLSNDIGGKNKLFVFKY